MMQETRFICLFVTHLQVREVLRHDIVNVYHDSIKLGNLHTTLV